MKSITLLFLLLLTMIICGCATSQKPMSEVPGKSNVLDNLASAVLNTISQMEEISEIQGASGVMRGAPELVRTSISTPKKNGKWTEKWVIQRRGYQLEYTIPFQDTPSGTTEYRVSNKPRRL